MYKHILVPTDDLSCRRKQLIMELDWQKLLMPKSPQ
jgi:hypothetical protein